MSKNKLSKYPVYKDSAVEWLGEIPEHWEVKKVTHVFNKIGSGTTPTAGTPKYYDNGNINWLQTGDLNDGNIIETSKKITFKAINDFSTLKQYPKESIVIAMYGATIGKLGYLNIETTTNQACCVLGNPNQYLSKFGFYSFMNAKTNIISMSYGGGQPNISQDLVKSLRLVVPPISEQTAIAHFLDDKTTKIDQAIAIKQKQIELLKERRQILIHKAVTRGLNDNVKLKDSGVEWIGEIPEHWEVKKVTHLFEKIGSGTTPTSGDNRYYDGDYNFLQTGDLNDGKINQTNRTLKEKAFRDFSSLKIYPKGSLVMAMYGATIGKLGILEIESATNQACCVFGKPKNILIEYFFQVLLAFRMEIISFGYGGGQPNISQDLIKSLRFPIPSKKEQTEIAEFIETATTKIATAISLKEQEIEKLKEYKMSLIDGVVSGKVKVC